MAKKENKYSGTVNLPQTDFPQRASLATREPQRLALWNDLKISEQLAARTDQPEYVLHDGPPYANGAIHIGHALNKLLKDIVVRYKAMSGFRTKYVPGWDCHGLPIEQKVVENLRQEGTYDQKSPLDIRRLCQEYALGWVDTQREQFIRLGVGGDWFHPYITMDPRFEVAILGGLKSLVEKGYVYKGLKVIHWDPVFETALAEAELEYNPNHVSPSVYVKFPLLTEPPVQSLRGREASVVIWTTTPWTLPANLGVSLHPEERYAAYEVNGEVLVVATELLADFKEQTGLEGGKVLEEFSGKLLDRQECSHPLLEKRSLVMMGDHVTMEQGTGCVHTAPGHGVEDFIIGAEYGLEPFNPVDEKGCFTAGYPDMQGESVFKANPRIVALLKEKGLLLANKPYVHSYPYSWRSHQPVIMRATEQWFMSIDKDGLREKAVAAVEDLEFVPRWGKERIVNMLKGRPDWCLSRQRSWGVPIPSIRDRETGESLLLPELIDKFASFVAEEGTDCWYARPLADFLPAGLAAHADRYEKEFNCLDVWFDSGCTHLAVLNENFGLSWPADLYLEGSDQHRGWFQTSLWVAMGVKGSPPYRQVLTHGFVLDEKGEAMSKSKGNVISPLDVVAENGADVLRMWVSSEDYRGDVSISQTSLQQMATSYRRIRNTLRFILGNLADFNPAADALPLDQLHEIDRWALHQLNELVDEVGDAYQRFEFHRVYQLVNGFCVSEMGALYLDMVKDRLYCELPSDPNRRSTQTVLCQLGSVLSRLLAPVLAFTADEVWEFLPGTEEASVHLASFPKANSQWNAPDLAEKWERLLTLRSEVTRQMEELRQGEAKVIGNSLDALVRLQTRDPETTAFLEQSLELLPTFLITSQVEIVAVDPGKENIPKELKTSGLHLVVEVGRAPGNKCPRCWRTTQDQGPAPHEELCARCGDVLRRIEDGEKAGSK